MARIVLITGSTDGIGKQTALDLAKKGYHVLVHGKNREKGMSVVSEIKKLTNNNSIDLLIADLSIQKEIKGMSDEIIKRYDHLDILINNAGVYQIKYELSEDNIEMTFAVNHLAPFLLTRLLLDLLKTNHNSRVINVSSMIHANYIDFQNLQFEKNFVGGEAYSLSKLCNILFTYKLSEILKAGNVTVNCLHPGVINTKILRLSFGNIGAPVQEGSKTSVFLADSVRVENITGKYFVDKKMANSKSITYDKEVQNRLWEISEKLTAGIG
jgi:NAD(P)-dependent dehydrogenase (short-subunit alcohol dehydrogenase family)